jgi:hypothetical protein
MTFSWKWKCVGYEVVGRIDEGKENKVPKAD